MPSPAARARAAIVVGLLLLAPLAACEAGETATISADVSIDEDPPASASTPPAKGAPSSMEESTSPGPPTRPSAKDTAGEAQGNDPGHDHGSSPRSGKRPRVVEGGGFASAVPGSDAPDREVDVGPQFRVSDDIDIEEIERLVRAVERIAKQQATGQPVLTGGSVAAAVGTFSYRWFADGSVRPNPAWVAANIRTESVPLLGNVTCHRVLFPQLRGALREVVSRGLASKIHPEEYGGCYVPRFIGRDPRNGLSLHSWGIAVDLNVPGNQRGVTGEIDRDVVGIFKKWGFAWGGDWRWTDPMHFELNRLVRQR